MVAHWPAGYSGDIRESMWCNGSTLARNARDVGSSPTLGTVFPIFVTPTTYIYIYIYIYIYKARWARWRYRYSVVSNSTIIIHHICSSLHCQLLRQVMYR